MWSPPACWAGVPSLFGQEMIPWTRLALRFPVAGSGNPWPVAEDMGHQLLFLASQCVPRVTHKGTRREDGGDGGPQAEGSRGSPSGRSPLMSAVQMPGRRPWQQGARGWWGLKRLLPGPAVAPPGVLLRAVGALPSALPVVAAGQEPGPCPQSAWKRPVGAPSPASDAPG